MIRRPAAEDESVESLATGSPSTAFLRDLARVSDRVPDAFDARLGAVGGAALQDGQALSSNGRFLVRRRLGAGAFGVVYEAVDQERNATVALKVLRRRDWRSISRFKNEFRSLVDTVHENLVQLYELHAEGDAWFFTMELVRGEDALSFVRPSGGPCDLARLRAVLHQLAGGLSFLHRSGKLHRDLKPSNVMVTDEGRVVIVDFGLVHDLADLQPSDEVFGTPAYMAPEQAAGLPVGMAADWYAVGVMLHEALTGRLPVAETDATAEGGQPERMPWSPSPPSALAAGLPDDLDRLCADLLARPPERRPTGHEVIGRLTPGIWAAESIVTGRESPSDGVDAPFIGREACLATLRDALVAAESGTTVVVLLEGRSGMGKSALAQRFVEEISALAPGRLVLAGRCFEQESVPYKGIDGLMDALCRWLRAREAAGITTVSPADLPALVRLFPQVREVLGPRTPAPVEDGDDPLVRQRAFVALNELLALAAPPVPVLVVDDLQWGDLDGAAFLAGLLHGRARSPLLLVAAYRSEDAATSPAVHALLAALSALGGQTAVRRIEVGPLEDLEAEALSRALLFGEDGTDEVYAEATLAGMVAEARGDPFLLVELAQQRRLARWLGDAPASQGDRAEPTAPELDQLLTARIARLPEPTRRLLEVVALDGQPIARAIAARAAFGSQRGSDALGAFNLLRTGRLIRSRHTEQGDEILAFHDRVREMVAHGIDVDTRREHHRRLALALEEGGEAEPERLLFHFRRAGRAIEAARYATDAARRAHEALAFDRAARLYREALALGGAGEGSCQPETSAQDERLRIALAEALAGAGRPREAALAYIDAARGAAPAEVSSRRRRAAELFLGAGYVDEGLATLRGVLQDVDVAMPSSLPRSLLGFVALRLRLGLRGLDFRERSEGAVGRRALLRIDACYAAAMGLFLTNPILAAESQARHLLVALEGGEPFRVARALALEAVFTAVRQRPGPSVDRLLSTVRALERRVDHPHLTGFVLLCECQIMQVSARWRHAHQLAVDSEAVLRRRCAGVSLEIDLARFRRTDLLWNLGEVSELSRLVPVVVEEARERGNRFLEMMVQLSTGSLLGLIDGRPDRAREAVAETLERWPRVRGSMIHVREVRAEAQIALYEGRGQDALVALGDGLSAIRRSGLSLARALTAELWLLRALAALSVGEDAGAARSIRSFAGLGFEWSKNPTIIVQAGLARRAGDLGGAIALLRRARATSLTLEASLYATAISRRLGEWGGGAEGRAQVDAADAWMVGQGIADPERMTGLLLGWV